MGSRQRVRYWVGVMAKDQVTEAIQKGYCEFCNGSKIPFKNVHPNSWFIYYSPGTKPLQLLREEGSDKGEVVRAFTAIGQVLPGDPYSIDLGNDNIVYRRRARYVSNTTDAPFLTIMDDLSFTVKINRRGTWGVTFRKGLINILKSDFYKICEAMNIDMPKRHNQIFEDGSKETKNENQQQVDVNKQ
jgi:hypothetical protein